MNSKTENPVVAWCNGLEDLVAEADSIASRIQRHGSPPIGKGHDPEAVRALAECYGRFLGRWLDVDSATDRLKHAGERLRNNGPVALKGHLWGIFNGLRTALANNSVDLPASSKVVLSCWFSNPGAIESRRSDGQPVTLATGRLEDLDASHWLHTILAPDDFYQGDRCRMVVLGPMEGGKPMPCYPVEWCKHYTLIHRRPQREEQRQREERERQSRIQAQIEREQDPEWKMHKLSQRIERVEAENRELKAKLETTNGEN